MKEVQSLVNKKEWKEINTPYIRDKSTREEWFEKEYQSDEHIIIKSGFIGGPHRAISFNTKTKEISYIT